MADSDLEKLRAGIDEVDERLFSALVERARLARQIGEVKRSGGEGAKAVYQAGREADLLHARLEQPHDPLPDGWLIRLYREIFAMCRALQREQEKAPGSAIFASAQESDGEIGVYSQEQIAESFAGRTIAYLGPEGTYTHEAAREIFFSADADARGPDGATRPDPPQLRAFPSIGNVFDALKSGQCRAAVIPISNNTTGTVEQHFHRVLEEGVQVFCELQKPIRHCLWSKDKQMDLKDIAWVYGHSQALSQCETWMVKKLGPSPLSGPVCSSMGSNALALERIRDGEAYHRQGYNEVMGANVSAEYKNRRRGYAAIAGPGAGERYGLHRIATDIQDRADNATVFWAVALQGWLPLPDQSSKSLTCHTNLSCYLPDRPGALHRLTALLQDRGLNMSYIQSFRNTAKPAPVGAAGTPTGPPAYEHVFHIIVDGTMDHRKFINDAADEGLLVTWLGTTVVRHSSDDGARTTPSVRRRG